jgi:hypothetical protein
MDALDESRVMGRHFFEVVLQQFLADGDAARVSVVSIQPFACVQPWLFDRR